MSLNKYKWLVNSAIHKKGDIVEMPEEDAKIRLILKHCVIYTEGEREEKRVVEVDKESIKEIQNNLYGVWIWSVS